MRSRWNGCHGDKLLGLGGIFLATRGAIIVGVVFRLVGKYLQVCCMRIC